MNHMNANNAYFIHHEMQKLQNRFSMATSQLAHAARVADIVRIKDVHVPPLLRSIATRERNALDTAAERKAESLVEAQFKKLESADEGSRATLLRQLRQDITSLSGNFPRLAQKVQQQLLLQRRAEGQGSVSDETRERFR